jgi:hypothetical protein
MPPRDIDEQKVAHQSEAGKSPPGIRAGLIVYRNSARRFVTFEVVRFADDKFHLSLPSIIISARSGKVEPRSKDNADYYRSLHHP